MKELETGLLERITDGFVALDRDWRFVFVNHQAAHILGRDRYELLGKNIWDEFPALLGDAFRSVCHQAMAQQVPRQLERHSARLARWIENRIYPAPDGLTIFFTDVTARKTAETRLRQYQDIFNLAEIGLVIGTGDGTVLQEMNPAFARMHGYAAEELRGRPVADVYAPEARGQLPAFIRRTEEVGHHVYESHHLRKDGSTFPVVVDTTAVKDDDGKALYRIVNVTDVTERREAEEALLASALRLQTLIANVQAGVIVEDSQGQLVLANERFCDMMGLGTAPAALLGANVARLAAGTSLLFADPEAFMARARLLRQQQAPVQGEDLPLSDGRVWERDYVPVFPGGGGDGYGGHLWLFRDVTERRRIEEQVRDAAVVLESQKAELEQANAQLEQANAQLEQANAQLEQANAQLEQANARLAEMATTDGLTGLLNARVFAERLAEEFLRARRYGEPLSLLLLDVDRFKSYNDSLGHLAGNALLRQLAGVLREHARETDLVARFGGEEFALILPHTEAGEAAALAERLRSAVEGTAWDAPPPLPAVAVPSALPAVPSALPAVPSALPAVPSALMAARPPITASFGVCLLTSALAGPDDLVSCADAAMYRAKAGGRNRVAVTAAE